MRERQEIDDPVLIRNRHALVVGNKRGGILTVRELHALAVSCGATGIKDVAQIVVGGSPPQRIHLRLTGKSGSQSDEIVEIESVRVVRAYAHTAVVNDDALERGTQSENAVSLVILLLFAHKHEPDLRVVYHELYLLLAACGVERYCDSPYPVCSEVRIEIFNAVLREHGEIVLRSDTQLEQGVAHLFHSLREMFPRHTFPRILSEKSERERGPRPVFPCLFVYKNREMTLCLHKR
ncbi:uncharacterized protein BN679_01658 [Prevotella sp. CAG:487]|nr:uncharacterized protein BN679_01658 [Prevotella sp. CAG:487]